MTEKEQKIMDEMIERVQKGENLFDVIEEYVEAKKLREADEDISD